MTLAKLTASDLARMVDELPRKRDYHYLSRKNKGRILIKDLGGAEGPVIIARYNPAKGEKRKEARLATLSTAMLWRVANAIVEGKPFNIDRILAASYNTRSVLAALLANCPQFHTCRPGRIEVQAATQSRKQGHTHLVWLPDEPHEPGVVSERKVDYVVAEHAVETVYDAIELPEHSEQKQLPVDVARRHAQIQIALVLIGRSLGCRSYIAKNDQAINYGGKPLSLLDGVVTELSDEVFLSSYPAGIKTGKFIDCVWFKGALNMPAVFEIEHSTGVTSGLTRMKAFSDQIPPIATRYVIVAADQDRAEVLAKATVPHFGSLKPYFLSYSAVEELRWITGRCDLSGCSDRVLDSFLEPLV